MLKHLRITNFAILSDVSIELGPGMNVLTRETGASKSLIVDAVALLRGGRASSDIPRAGSDEAVVEAVFRVPEDLRPRVRDRLLAAGLEADDEIIIRRVISRGGRSRVHVNGGLTTVAVLADIASELVDLAGQHAHQRLADAASHREILDAFGVEPRLVAEMRRSHERWAQVAGDVERLRAESHSRVQREDFLRFQLEEIDAAELRDGLDQELNQERERLRASERLGQATRRAEEQLYSGETAVIDVLVGLARDLEPLTALDSRLEAVQGQIGEARLQLEDAAQALRRYADGVSDDPQRLAEIEDLLHSLGKICRKHGPTGTDGIRRRDELRTELEGLVTNESRLLELEGEVREAETAALVCAQFLTRARKSAAVELSDVTTKSLQELGMAGARLSVRIDAGHPGLSAHGVDVVEILLCANPGEDPKPLIRVASGGELSRVMLALKLALRSADAVAAHVFDEVDAGIGGKTAEVVGRKIREVAARRQVICVTHLASVAALADRHFIVEQHVEGGRADTRVTVLSDTARRDEIARMLGGREATARAHAEEMLAGAKPKKAGRAQRASA